jgi:glycosyltransferase involved in cell wall biosynthesis
VRILLINYEYPPIGAGAANATFHLAKELHALGNEVVVLTAGFESRVGYEKENGVHVYRLASRRKKISSSGIFEMLSYVLHARKELRKVINQHKIEKAILFFSIPCGFLGPYLKRKYGIPYLISLRGGDVPGMEKGINFIHRLIAPLRRRILRNASAIIANSKGLAAASEKADPYQVEVIPNGVDTEFFRPIERQESDEFVFLFVGRFQPQKNLIVLLNAFANISTNKNIRLKLVGDGPQKNELINQCRILGIEDKVEFMPWQNKEGLLRLYHSSDVLINYSLYEGMPNVVLEAMACGLPIIASKIMGHEELVEEGLNGFLVELDNFQKLVLKMEVLLSDNPLRKMMMIKSRVKIEIYSWLSVAERYLAAFN